jgi:hypothetical protein
MKLYWGDLKGKYHLGYIDIDGRVVLRWIIQKYDVRVWI